MIQNKELNNQLNDILSNTDSNYESLVKEFVDECANCHIIDMMVATMNQCEDLSRVCIASFNPPYKFEDAIINVSIFTYKEILILAIGDKYLPLIDQFEDNNARVQYIVNLLSQSKLPEERVIK